MEEYFKILGLEVKDCVTKFQGVATSVSFDLYGCVQVLVQPKVKDGKQGDAHWFDFKRLVHQCSIPVMDQPTFALVPGGERHPMFSEKPSL